MNDYTPGAIRAPIKDPNDEYELLAALLQRLEQSDNLSLDELDAVIAQADAAYKSRLARLERTRQMIGKLGNSSAVA